MTWNYIAGFFDGEGSLTHNGKGYRVTISQTNFEVLESIRMFSGVGYVIKPAKRKAHWKDNWVYYVARQKDVYSFMMKMKPFLVVKRDLFLSVEDKILNFVKRQKEKNILRQKKAELAVKLRNEGYTYREIGKRTNTDFGQIRRVILKHGGCSSIG